MTPIATALPVFVAFLVGCVIGRFERHDRRITHEAPRTIQPTLRQLRAWDWRRR